MHYGDKEQVEENIIVIGVYLHEKYKKDSKGSYQPTGKLDIIEVKSIQECRYVSPWSVSKLIKKPGKFIKITDQKLESWYLVTLSETDWGELEVLSIGNVSKSENEFHRLH